MTEPFCLQRVKTQIESLNGDNNPPAVKVRRLTLDGLSCLIQMYEEQAHALESLKKVSEERNSWKYIIRDRVLPNLLTTAILGFIGWLALVNNHIQILVP